MAQGQGQQSHNHCNEAFIPSIINSLTVKTSWFCNHYLCPTNQRNVYCCSTYSQEDINISNVVISLFIVAVRDFSFL